MCQMNPTLEEVAKKLSLGYAKVSSEGRTTKNTFMSIARSLASKFPAFSAREIIAEFRRQKKEKNKKKKQNDGQLSLF